MNILFFGTQKGFDRFQYENISSHGITYILCDKANKWRGIEFHGWLVHYTANSDLRREVQNESGRFESRVTECLNRLMKNNEHS